MWLDGVNTTYLKTEGFIMNFDISFHAWILMDATTGTYTLLSKDKDKARFLDLSVVIGSNEMKLQVYLANSTTSTSYSHGKSSAIAFNGDVWRYVIYSFQRNSFKKVAPANTTCQEQTTYVTTDI
jgi:hypothetical protein